MSNNDTQEPMNNASEEPKSGRRRPVAAVARGTGWLFRFCMKLTLIVLFIGTGVLVGGFLQFTNSIIDTKPATNIEPAQAIVALTGGANRVSAALDLLAKKKGDRLLISGVNQQVKISELRRLNATRALVFNCCVDIEKLALNTIGNAVETKKWLESKNFSSFILVTSGYHMPRSLLEFRKLMPEAKITPYPVAHKGLQEDDWWQQPQILRLMISEYMKYVGAWTRDKVLPKATGLLRATMGNS